MTYTSFESLESYLSKELKSYKDAKQKGGISICLDNLKDINSSYAQIREEYNSASGTDLVFHPFNDVIREALEHCAANSDSGDTLEIKQYHAETGEHMLMLKYSGFLKLDLQSRLAFNHFLSQQGDGLCIMTDKILYGNPINLDPVDGMYDFDEDLSTTDDGMPRTLLSTSRH